MNKFHYFDRHIKRKRYVEIMLVSIFIMIFEGLCITQIKSDTLSRQEAKRKLFYGLTSDMFYWDGVRCMMSRSPLDVFDQYEGIYSDVPRYKILAEFGKLPFQDKNYGAVWGIIDSTLYLCDVDFRYSRLSADKIKKLFPENLQYKKLEDLVRTKFQKSTIYKDVKIPISPCGVIPAFWVNGAFYIKRFRTNESIDQWKALPCKRLEFKQGRLISVDDVLDMDARDLKD